MPAFSRSEATRSARGNAEDLERPVSREYDVSARRLDKDALADGVKDALDVGRVTLDLGVGIRGAQQTTNRACKFRSGRLLPAPTLDGASCQDRHLLGLVVVVGESENLDTGEGDTNVGEHEHAIGSVSGDTHDDKVEFTLIAEVQRFR